MDLVKYLKTIDFKGIGIALDFENLKKLTKPVILYVKIRNNEHFTVYKYADDNYVYLADPSFGNIKVKNAKFIEMFYTRNLKNQNIQGKLLAIIPIQNQENYNLKFLKRKYKSNFVEEILKIRTIF